VIVRITESGEVLETVRVDNDPLSFVRAVMHEDPNPEVALEATYGWYWAADLLEAEGATVHLVHPLGLHWDSRRVKTSATPPSSPSGSRGAICPKPGSHPRSCVSCVSS
jgi:transposase